MLHFKTIALLSSVTLIGCTSSPHAWQGQSGSKRVFIELETTPEGTSQAFLSLPEQWIDKAKADTLVLSDESILAIFNRENIRFEGSFHSGKDSIQAEVTTYGKTREFALGKVDSLQPVYFAQNPRPPYLYRSEEVTYESCDSIQVAGTLTIPQGKGPFPAAIIISGTGKQDRDGTFSGHKPFFKIADYLTRQGFIVLRADDRGIGKTNGIYEEATTSDFARDAQAGINYLKQRPETDTKHIGVIGHSEGGQVALMLGADSPDVSFVISLAGVGVDGLQILKLQNDAILRTTPGMTPERVDQFMSLFNTLFDKVHSVPLEQPLDIPLRQAFDQWVAQQDEATLKAVNFNDGRDEMFFSRYLHQAQGRWYREMINYDPENYIPRIHKPVLALNGDKDIMVPAKENLESIKQLLDKGGNTQYKIVELPGLNHMFQRCKECTREEIPDLEDVFSEEALQIMGDWLRENVQKDRK